MNYDDLFKLLSFSPGPFWLILFFWPKNTLATRLFDAYLILLSAVFSVMIIPLIPNIAPIIASPTLAAIQSFLGSEAGATGAWNHMILGDLWIGRWIIHDAERIAMPVAIRALILLLVMFFGPLGLFSYLMYKLAVTRDLSSIFMIKSHHD